MANSSMITPGQQPAVAAAGPSPAFDWPLANEAEALLRRQLDAFLQQHRCARDLAERMRDETGTDFFEWIDHFILSPEQAKPLQRAGFTRDNSAETPNAEAVLIHPAATLPRVLLADGQDGCPASVALRPESLADFIACHQLGVEPEGEPWSRYRRVLVAEENGARLEAVERRAYNGFVPEGLSAAELRGILQARELWRIRQRLFPKDTEGFRVANQTLERVLELVGSDLACQFFFESERAYWEKRNRAGRVQKRRQDALGLGWGNHDHHTFRSSREHFSELIEFLLQLGFVKRERFYAGAEAGWGAQVLEQPVVGIVVFADVDLLPEETQLDFSATQLPPASRLNTVGLWVGLHGESFLEAGMHHLEARFDFDRLREQLQKRGVEMMNPFSDFEFLRQAFTEGERWPVRRERAERLRAAGLITREQSERFVLEGALGSHLENLQRHGGFKGFNQKSVSVVIAATDPRKEHFAHSPAVP